MASLQQIASRMTRQAVRTTSKSFLSTPNATSTPLYLPCTCGRWIPSNHYSSASTSEQGRRFLQTSTTRPSPELQTVTDHRRDDLITSTSTSTSKPSTSSQAASTSSPRNPAPPRPPTTSVPPTATVEPKDPKAKTSPSPVGVKVEQSASVGAVEKEKKTGPKFREFKAQKAALSLTPTAVEKLKDLMASPTPQQLRISVTNKGCAGMSYNLSYVTKAGRFDEVVEQDGVRVLIDSKALFSIIGSEMDWKEERLGERFVFKNPNIKEECGCGESFLT